MNYMKPIFSLFLVLLMSLAVVNCARSKFSANTATPNSNAGVIVDDNGLPVGEPFGTDTSGNTVFIDANGINYIIDANGNTVVTDANGTPIIIDVDINGGGNNGTPVVNNNPPVVNNNPPVGIINVQGRISPNQVGKTIVINPSSPGVTCRQWVSSKDVHNIHMRTMIRTATNLRPRVGNRPAIHADEASLDRVCLEMGCGQALQVYTREFASPYNNTIVRWLNNGKRWVKFGADWSQSRNVKIGNKNGTKAILCDNPGSFSPGKIRMYHTD